MPNVGIRVTISSRRQKAKKSPAIIVSIYEDEGGLCAVVFGAAVFDSTLDHCNELCHQVEMKKKVVLCGTSRQCHSRLSFGLTRGSVNGCASWCEAQMDVRSEQK